MQGNTGVESLDSQDHDSDSLSFDDGFINHGTPHQNARSHHSQVHDSPGRHFGFRKDANLYVDSHISPNLEAQQGNHHMRNMFPTANHGFNQPASWIYQLGLKGLS